MRPTSLGFALLSLTDLREVVMRGLSTVANVAAPVRGAASSRFAWAAGGVSVLGGALHTPSEGGGGSGRVDHLFLWVVLIVIALALAVLTALIALRLGQLSAQQHRRPETPEADLTAGSSQSEPSPASGDHKMTEPDPESLVSIS